MRHIATLNAPLIALILLGLVATRAGAQQDHDHDHDGLHFSHPLVNESPSPDTKLRLDFLWTRIGDPTNRVTERGARVEGEFAFTPGLSLAVTAPYTWRDGEGRGGVHGMGNTEVSLKAASAKWDERGFLFGGGLSVGIPTGNDSLGIGSSRAVDVEPFVDAAIQRGGLELVAFGRYGTTVHNEPGVVADREVSVAASALYPVARVLEALIEAEAVRPISGDVRETATTLAPGVKVYPFGDRRIMAGVSAPIGLSGEAKQARGLLVSLFYHF